MCLKKIDLKAPFKIRNPVFNTDYIQNDLCRCLEGKEELNQKDLTELWEEALPAQGEGSWFQAVPGGHRASPRVAMVGQGGFLGTWTAPAPALGLLEQCGTS